MKKTLPVLVFALCAFVAFAQEPQPGVAPAVVVQFLGFSEPQAARFQQLLQGLQTSFAPMEQQIKLRQQRLDQLLNSEPANPAAIGAALVELRALQKQAERILQTYHENFLTLLTADQREKAGAVVQASQLLPAVRAFAELRLVAPPR